MTRFLVLVALFALPAIAAPVGVRAHSLQARIDQGVGNGQLTRPEAARLQRQQDRLRAEVTRDRIDGGGLSAAERAKLQRHEDRLSRRVYTQKHDGQTRR